MEGDTQETWRRKAIRLEGLLYHEKALRKIQSQLLWQLQTERNQLQIKLDNLELLYRKNNINNLEKDTNND